MSTEQESSDYKLLNYIQTYRVSGNNQILKPGTRPEGEGVL